MEPRRKRHIIWRLQERQAHLAQHLILHPRPQRQAHQFSLRSQRGANTVTNTLILHPHQQPQVHHSLRSQRGANTVTNMTRIPMATIAGKKQRIKRKKLSLALGEKRRSQRNIVIEKASRAALKVKVKKIALKGKVIESTLMLSLDLVPELVPLLDKNL